MVWLAILRRYAAMILANVGLGGKHEGIHRKIRPNVYVFTICEVILCIASQRGLIPPGGRQP
jgi:hypothetical protein